MNTITMALIGGALIGIAVTIMLLFNGRATGISGIINGILSHPNKESLWRLSFIIGMLGGGLALRTVSPEVFQNTSGRGIIPIAIAGLLVGFGTVMGGGCTSGHGVCGVSRLSVRSVIATLIFILFGLVSVAAAKYFLVGN